MFPAPVETVDDLLPELRPDGQVEEEHRYVGTWMFRLPLVRTMRDRYRETVAGYDRDLIDYFDSTERIDPEDRLAVRAGVVEMVRTIDGHQGWLNLASHVRTALTYLMVWPTWLVVGVATPVLAWTGTPMWIKVGYVGVAALIIAFAFNSLLRDPLHPPAMSRLGRTVTAAFAAASAVLLLSAWSRLAVPAALGVCVLALVAVAGTTVAAAYTVEIHNTKARAALYLTEVGGLVLVATMFRPSWPRWIADGVLAGIWASLTVTIFSGICLVLLYVATSVYARWKNRRYTVAEITQTLLWLGLRLDDADKPEDERYEVSRTSPVYGPVSTAWDLEYVARLVECLPRHLRGWDRTTDLQIGERCRCIAATVRGLKLWILLNQSRHHALAESVMAAVTAVARGDWHALASSETTEQRRRSAWGRLLRRVGGMVTAVAPLGVVLFLQHFSTSVDDQLLSQILPVAVTWLVVSIAAWIDPGTGNRISDFRGILPGLPFVRST